MPTMNIMNGTPALYHRIKCILRRQWERTSGTSNHDKVGPSPDRGDLVRVRSHHRRPSRVAGRGRFPLERRRVDDDDDDRLPGLDDASIITSSSTTTHEGRRIEYGEMLYPLIRRTRGELLAGKITGMLLFELDDDELMRLIECPRALDGMISEAMGVLEAVTFGR
jgi:hypothetical protein